MNNYLTIIVGIFLFYSVKVSANDSFEPLFEVKSQEEMLDYKKLEKGFDYYQALELAKSPQYILYKTDELVLCTFSLGDGTVAFFGYSLNPSITIKGHGIVTYNFSGGFPADVQWTHLPHYKVIRYQVKYVNPLNGLSETRSYQMPIQTMRSQDHPDIELKVSWTVQSKYKNETNGNVTTYEHEIIQKLKLPAYKSK